MKLDLSGRYVLVTGGSRGIGAAIGRTLADAGAAVAINCRESADEAKGQRRHPLPCGAAQYRPIRHTKTRRLSDCWTVSDSAAALGQSDLLRGGAIGPPRRLQPYEPRDSMEPSREARKSLSCLVPSAFAIAS